MKKNKKTIEEIFQAKRERRQELAKLPVEEKLKILIQLQMIAVPILAARGLKRKAWKI